jgi:AbrB family looped-hinge helix DNA binding protein
MSEISIASMTSKGQVTIPKEVRDTLGLKEGDRLMFVTEGDHATIRKTTNELLSSILSRQAPRKEDSVKFQRNIRDEWARRK